MTIHFFERFTSPGTMVDAERELLALGDAAVPILESLLNGEAKNFHNVPYRSLGLPLRCALEVACQLGPLAKPLEPYLLEELRAGNFVAARALGSLGSLEDVCVDALANQLGAENWDLAFESAAALLKCERASASSVLGATARSPKAAWVLTRVRRVD